MKRYALVFGFALTELFSCQPAEQTQTQEEEVPAEDVIVQAFTLDGKALYEPERNTEQLERLNNNLEKAKADFEAEKSEENYIWLGRRVAYFNRYNEAIGVFSQGIQAYPASYKLYRHRGHRFVSTRKFDAAIRDFERAVILIGDLPIETEPDGAPNAMNIPLSNTHFNIYYHLGLAHYLKGNWEKAMEAYTSCLEYSINDDLKVATLDWMYMTYRKMGEEEKAAAVLDQVTDEMEIIENDSYYKRLKMYKGELQPEDLLSTENADDITIATQGYGVANYLIAEGKKEEGNELLNRVVSGRSWSAFGFIAAEADLNRAN